MSDKLAAGLKLAQKRLRAFGAFATSIGSAITKAAVIPAAGFLISAKIFTEFDDRMRVVRAVTGATKDEFAALRDEAKRLGAETSFSAREVAGAMTELGRAGFTPTAILASTEAVLALSRATDTELARATEIAGASLRGFNLDVSEMGRVTDVLTATANGSAQTLDDLFEALKPVAPIAAEAGESIEQTAAAIAVLANNGIKGSLAGNSLARAYKNLADEAKQTELRSFGVEAVDAAGNLRPLADIINDLAKSTKNLGTAKRLSIFETLFGRGQAAALKLASSGEAFDDLASTITNSAGRAKAAAAEMDAGVGGSFRKMKSAVEAVAISVGEAIESPLKILADAGAKVASVVRFWIDNNKLLVASIFAIVAVAGIAGVSLLGVGLLSTIASAAIGGLLSVMAGLCVAFGIVLSPIAIASVAIAAFIALLIAKSGLGAIAIKFLADTFKRLADFAGPIFKGIGDAISSGNIELAVKILGKGMELAWAKSIGGMKSIWIEFSRFVTVSALSIGETVASRLTAAVTGIRLAYASLTGGDVAPIIADFGNAASVIGGGTSLAKELANIGAGAGNQELADAISDLESSLKALTKEAANGELSDTPLFGKLKSLRDSLDAGGVSATNASNRSVQGTFNANAVSGFAGSKNEVTRTAVATEKTAKNTEKLIKKIADLPGSTRFA